MTPKLLFQAGKLNEAITALVAEVRDNPTDAQRSALDALDDATIRAADLLKTNCPADESLTPPGRVTAMEQRLNTMLQAIKVVQPALENFYGTLTDEQKKEFKQPRPGAGSPPRAGEFMSPTLQVRLKLTADQKKVVQELQQEADRTLDKLLTDDQKKDRLALQKVVDGRFDGVLTAAQKK